MNTFLINSVNQKIRYNANFQESEQSRLSFAGSFILTPLFRRAHAAIKVYEVPLIGRFLPLNYIVYCQGKSEDAEPVSSDT